MTLLSIFRHFCSYHFVCLMFSFPCPRLPRACFPPISRSLLVFVHAFYSASKLLSPAFAAFGNELKLVCAIKYNQRGDDKTVIQIIPVAANFGDKGLNAKTSLLPTAETSQVEGVRVELHGPAYNEQDQSTVIELTCDRSVEVYFFPAFCSLLAFPAFLLFPPFCYLPILCSVAFVSSLAFIALKQSISLAREVFSGRDSL